MRHVAGMLRMIVPVLARVNELRPISMSYVTYECVMAHMEESRHI